MTSSADDSAEAWWNAPFSVFQTNIQEIDSDLDVEKTLDAVEDYGADTWLLNTGGIISFYPSALSSQTHAPHLATRPSGDLTGDAVAGAHRRGIRFLARADFSKVSGAVAAAHPDWLYLSPAGERQVYNGLVTVCPSGDYYQSRALEVVDEILDRYPVDGFFFNWFGFSERDYSGTYHGVCQCASCTAGFAAFADGRALPHSPGDATYAEWRQFTEQVLDDLTTRFIERVRARRDDVALILGRRADVVYDEASNGLGRAFWPLHAAEIASAHAASSPDRPLLVNCVSFPDFPYRMSGEQPARFDQYLLQTISRGARPSTYIMGAPGRIPYAHLPTSRDIVRFYRAHPALYRGLTPASDIAVVRPALADPHAGHAGHPARAEFEGVCAAMLSSGVAFDIVPAGTLAHATLSRFRLLVLPSTGALPSDAVAALDEYVESGGAVLTTGDSALDADGRPQLAAAPNIAPTLIRRDGEEWSSYVSLAPQPDASRDRYVAPLIAVIGEHRSFSWHDDAELVGTYLSPAPFGPPEKCYGHRADGQPARAVRQGGRGRVATIPWTIGTTYGEFETDEVRDHLLDAVLDLATPLVRVRGGFVDASATRAGNDLIVHLINMTGQGKRTFRDPVPLRGVTVRIHGCAGMHGESFVEPESATTADVDGDLLVTIDRLDRFEVLRLKTLPTGPQHE
ncbi:MAG TPA: alpha-amylase family protein [Pseudolysinimonas sp.]|nr:alpha-amylase family protein [Pseudolysinimonas sp.]